MTKQRDGLKIQTQELQTRLDDTTTQLTDTRNQLADTEKQLDDMTTQFNTATDRVRSVANEKAQAADDAALMTTLFDMSREVSQGMDACIENLQKLQTYLVDYSSYDSDSLISYAGAINSDCNQARSDSDALSKKLGG